METAERQLANLGKRANFFPPQPAGTIGLAPDIAQAIDTVPIPIAVPAPHPARSSKRASAATFRAHRCPDGMRMWAEQICGVVDLTVDEAYTIPNRLHV
jgi:hypothetical protein